MNLFIARVSNTLGPLAKHFYDLGQIFRAAESFKLLAANTTYQPVRLSSFLIDGNKHESIQSSFFQINRDSPSRIIKRLNRYAKSVFPVSIALICKPLLKPFNAAHRQRCPPGSSFGCGTLTPPGVDGSCTWGVGTFCRVALLKCPRPVASNRLSTCHGFGFRGFV